MTAPQGFLRCRLAGIALTAALTLLSAGPAAARSEQSIDAFNQGVQLFNAGQWTQAIPHFDKAIDRDSSFSEAYYARAACKHSSQDTQGALSDLNQAIELNSKYVDAYALRGAIWYEVEQWDSALQDFQFVIQHRPDDAQALLGHGVVSLKQDHRNAAEGDFRRYLALKPKDPMAPQIRQLLASMKLDSRQIPGGELPEGSAERVGAGGSVGRGVSPESDRLAQGLVPESHQLSDNFNQKVIRGERAEVVGDPPSVPGTVSSRPGVDPVPRIIEPQ